MDTSAPVFGYVLIGGPLCGARVRDVRLANELSRRGYKGHAWWAMEQASFPALDAAIPQEWFFQTFRNAPFLHGPTAEFLGRCSYRIMNESKRQRIGQKNTWLLRRQMVNMTRRVCNGVEGDAGLIRRFAGQIDRSGVTHLFPNLAIFAPYITAATRLVGRKVSYTVTFQGYELYSRYAREIGLEDVLFAKLREAVDASSTPAVAVSEDYRQRIHADIGIPLDQIVVIPPGVPEEVPMAPEEARGMVCAALPGYQPDLPLISYVGRQDSEKGIDLLLYAARMLAVRGLKFQLAICGGTAFGGEYRGILRQIADQLELPVLWQDSMSNELRNAIYQASHCTVYPSIHREPFGMVPVESMMLGTPVVVADTGGVSELVGKGDERGGLTFRSWDSADLADQLATMIEDEAAYASFARAARERARNYSVENLGDRVLELVCPAG